MGRGKQVIILVSLLLLRVAGGFCFEENFSQDFPQEISSKLEKLQIYFETEMYEETAALLDELIAQFPNELRFEYLRAIVDYQRGDYNRAQRVFIEFVEQYPEVAEPHYLLGQIYLKEGDIDTARQYFRRYCEFVPEDYEAQRKLSSLSISNSCAAVIMKDGEKNLQLVKKIGFYGACIHARKGEALKLINGNFRTWSSMGIDFAYPVDLRGKQIVLKLRGKQGGEKLELSFRDKFTEGYEPQLMLAPEGDVLRDWQDMKVVFGQHRPKIDLSSVVHMGLEFGFSTVRNPAQSTLFVKDIIIEDVRN